MNTYKEIVEAITWHMQAYEAISREYPPFRLSYAEEAVIFNVAQAFNKSFPEDVKYEDIKGQLAYFMGCPIEIMTGE